MTGSGALGLRQRVSALLLDAVQVYADTVWAERFSAAARDLDGPLRVALAGKVKAGKSTLLNGLVGQAIAPTDAGECTRIVTEYSYGESDSAYGVLAPPSGPSPADASGVGREASEGTVPLDVRRERGRLVVDLAGCEATRFIRLLVSVSSPRLRGLTVIDTPGLSSLTTGLGVRAERFLVNADEGSPGPDAVVYLMRQLHVSDSDFLEAFRDPHARGVPPVNAVGVLSRADEIGGGREDALAIAADIAHGYAQEPRLRSLVQTVVPVSGLLAEAAVTLSEEEFDELEALAKLSPSVTDALLLSVDRFTAPRRFVPVNTLRRSALLDRLGLFGIRWSLSTLRSGTATSRDDLSDRLADHSGVNDLQAVLRSQILGRRDVLKADAAFRLIQRAVSTTERPGARRLASVTERLTVGVHDFQELRLLNELRLGTLDVEDEERRQMEALLGASGDDPRTRLEISPQATDEDLEQALLDRHAHWQVVANDPFVAPDLVRAAAVLQRTLQGMRHGRGKSSPEERAPSK